MMTLDGLLVICLISLSEAGGCNRSGPASPLPVSHLVINGDVHLLAAQTTQDPSQPSNFSTKEQLIVDNMCLTVHPPAAGNGK